MKNESAFLYIKLYHDDLIRYGELLSDAELGQLVRAVTRYSQTGEPEDVPEAIKWPYAEQRQKINGAQQAYRLVCEKRAASGSKGGKAKAENEKAKAKPAKATIAAYAFKPPDKKEFLRTAQDMRTDKVIDYTSKQLEELFDYLCENDWTINGIPITNKQTWIDALGARFASPPYSIENMLDWICWKRLFSASYGRITTLYDFMENYDESSGQWCIDGEKYDLAQDAADAYVATLANATSDSNC